MPPGIVAVQFGLGHVCCARNCSSVGPVTESEGTVSLPFFGESWPEVVEAVKVPWCCESDGFPPALMQTTVAEYVALKSAVAFRIADAREFERATRDVEATNHAAGRARLDMRALWGVVGIERRSLAGRSRRGGRDDHGKRHRQEKEDPSEHGCLLLIV
jgi:hypothetical protein